MLSYTINKHSDAKLVIRKRILYVEDDVSSQFLVEHILRNKYDLEMAAQANEALKMAEESEYDLILMDIKLGKGITGIELTHKLRMLPKYKETPILAVTAYAMPGDDEYIKGEGCDDYVSKPINFSEFRQKVDRLLSGPRF
ncbi:MAG: response regulator [Bacteroidales bacterium]|nr:response regulator [Bacteroidales bacterium]